MEKFAKRYLTVEIIIMFVTFFAGFFEPAIWLYGTFFAGIILSFVGAIVSWLWCRERIRAKGLVSTPFAFAIGNLVVFIGFVLFVLIVFGSGISFLM